MAVPQPFREFFLRRLEALCERNHECFPPDALPSDHRRAAVLLLFWPDDADGVRVVFTRRPEAMPSHPGQVSFPGGRHAPEDRSIIDTALREAHEELGIDPAKVRVMGRLDDAWSFSGHHVIPVVGWTGQQPEFRPDPREVEEVIIADVATLMRPEIVCQHRVERNGVVRVTQAYRWDGGYVWGLTADILMELLLWLEDKPSNRAAARLESLKALRSLDPA
jgi:8-oxo-dGTP pyrophosphatase MutT (NUDIX family)